jgi:hypothetical protein
MGAQGGDIPITIRKLRKLRAERKSIRLIAAELKLSNGTAAKLVKHQPQRRLEK